MGNRFITVFEDGSLNFHKGEIPQEVLEAADDGLYDVIDITNPDDPLRYWDEGWTNVDELPTEFE
jgi:hypothetical protein